MKTLSLFVLGVFISFQAHSQVFEWVRSEIVNYNINPSYPVFPVDYDETNGRIVHARLDSFAFIYGSSLVGKTLLESRDTNGIAIWQFSIGNLANVQKISVEPSGNIIVGGQYRETLRFGNNDTLEFINAGFNGWNFYLIKLDTQGNLIWKRNMSITWPLYDGIEALSNDPVSGCWYALTDFFNAKIVNIDANGNDVTTRSIDNGKTIGNISFDSWGGMYISGGAESGNFIMDADTFHTPYSYNMFIARFDPQGNPAWAHFGNDITFQRPMITTDPAGNVFFAGMRFDSLSFNGTFIHAPLVFGDFFAFKADSAGNVLWVVKQPPLLIGPFGGFDTGSGLFVDSDGEGNFYMGGIHHGFVDWGNGYTSSSGNFNERKTAVAHINSSGSTQWVKIGGSNNSNYMHALAVSNGGSCYFTGSFSDSANFDNIFIPSSNFYNFALGKIRVLPTGFPDVNSESLITVFPNPAKYEIYFSKDLIGSEIKIFDVTGRLVIEELNNSSGAVNISSLMPGSYLIQISNQNNSTYARFLKND